LSFKTNQITIIPKAKSATENKFHFLRSACLGLFYNIGELLVQIRKSLGYPKTQVDKRDMFTWLIKDIEKMEGLIDKAKQQK
jgi:hypothetical protein